MIPLASAVVGIFLGKRIGKGWGNIATAAMGVSFLCSLFALLSWRSNELTDAIVWRIPWIPMGNSGWIYLGLLADSLTMALMVMVTLISTLVHLYSIGYMAGDKRYERFFSYLSLFTFSMLGIVTANGLMQLFVFWELVGLTSYLLIGFWFEKRGPQLACKKAFVMNRIGDAGFLIGFGILFQQLGSQVLLPAVHGGMFESVKALLEAQGHSITNPPMWLTVAGIGLFFGAIGKSAQFPLHTWLPDAMEGPTPVSSIVHSATMVAAGVYLTARIYPILTPAAHLFVATIGLITLVMAACMAVVMTDIKRVLAYSTLSQLGYMILGLGAGAWGFALFHLITHAFFKCALFQCSGSVINSAHHEQDMTQYGGFAKKMPKTALAYLICTLAISGASIGPWFGLTGGYYSKDGIIAGCVNYGQAIGGLGNLFWIGPLVIAYVTAFYMARSFALTFMGTPRNKEIYDHLHEAPWTMTVPQFVLSFMAITSVPFAFGWVHMIESAEPQVAWLQGINAVEASGGMHFTHYALLLGLGWIVAIGAGVWMYKDGFGKADKALKTVPGLDLAYTWAHNKFYFDGFYDIFVVNVMKILAAFAFFIDYWLVDGLVRFSAMLGRFFGWIAGGIDKHFVDRLVNGAAEFAQNTGGLLRTTHQGRIRGYVLILFASVSLITIIVIVVALH